MYEDWINVEARLQRGPSSLCSGNTDWNIRGFHRSGITGGGRGTVGWQPEAHMQTVTGDDWIKAPHEATGSALAALKSAAATSQVAFSSAMNSEFGSTWWDQVKASGGDVAMRIDALAML